MAAQEALVFEPQPDYDKLVELQGDPFIEHVLTECLSKDGENIVSYLSAVYRGIDDELSRRSDLTYAEKVHLNTAADFFFNICLAIDDPQDRQPRIAARSFMQGYFGEAPEEADANASRLRIVNDTNGADESTAQQPTVSINPDKEERLTIGRLLEFVGVIEPTSDIEQTEEPVEYGVQPPATITVDGIEYEEPNLAQTLRILRRCRRHSVATPQGREELAEILAVAAGESSISSEEVIKRMIRFNDDRKQLFNNLSGPLSPRTMKRIVRGHKLSRTAK